MSSFILKRTNDGYFHLYLDEPSNEGFLKVAKAKKAKLVRERNYSHVIIFDENSYTKTLFGIIDDKVYQVKLPNDAEFSFIDNVCTFKKDNLWYTMKFCNGKFEEYLLGEKFDTFLPTPQNIKYRTIRWIFFLRKKETHTELCHFVNGTLIELGSYSNITHNNREILYCTNDNHLYNIFNPNSTSPQKGTLGVAIEEHSSLDGIYLPTKALDKWTFYPKYRLLGKNCAYLIETYGNQKVIKLFSINGEKLELFKTSRDFEFDAEPFSLRIDEMKYFFDAKTRMMDLKNPKPTFKRKLKNFFGID
ncbi:MAG: hypothetical protein IJZ30_03550 [Alphaproteobacteria bacterium]|nr:hypothetical protein [Alphaproteobacteria bacterium]